MPPLGFVQIVAFAGLLEYTFEMTKGKDSVPGDYYGMTQRLGNNPSWVDFQTRELNNGRYG